MSEWLQLSVSEPIRNALAEIGFNTPTPIQSEVLPVALTKKLDVFGAAETGSGKTLAFLIPIIETLIEDFGTESTENGEQKKKAKRRRVSAVILAPTRELVLQIHVEFKRIAQFTPFRSVAIIGGMSEEKQERLLGKKPHVIVATPGRFWSLVQRNDYASDFSRLRQVVIDEIDRMVEKGHFKEVENILEAIHANTLPKLQTLVFSATLTFIVLPNPGRAQKTREEKLREISKATRMRKNYRLVDVTNEFTTPTTLTERRMCCSSLLQKDSCLYFTLLSYPARTLVFTNSIDAAQRLHGLLIKLQIRPTPLILHAKMHEKKRLKNLERFSQIPNSILLATDVAARGLDIQGIENVIHYQIPRTAEDYVHRSGRTARASRNGMSIMILDPKDVTRYRKICKNLKRTDDLPTLDSDNSRRMAAIEKRVHLASELERLEYQMRKVTNRKSWEVRMAKEADIMLSDEEDSDPESEMSNKRRLKKSAERALKAALTQPLPASTLSFVGPAIKRDVI
ncbi:ATP-dependent RNA helicase DDX24 [Aphelenchoides besseyi]|nr:ATP-dependent RNA helicase DDX24 [Aphelenchoides besseyi]KAI6209908.1 ATP-dependent RNA helicase DDX24 [Aphelenchoides besseyi]